MPAPNCHRTCVCNNISCKGLTPLLPGSVEVVPLGTGRQVTGSGEHAVDVSDTRPDSSTMQPQVWFLVVVRHLVTSARIDPLFSAEASGLILSLFCSREEEEEQDQPEAEVGA